MHEHPPQPSGVEKYDYTNPETPELTQRLFEVLGLSETTPVPRNISLEFAVTQAVDDVIDMLGPEKTALYFAKLGEHKNIVEHFREYPETIQELPQIFIEPDSFLKNENYIQAYIVNSKQRTEEMKAGKIRHNARKNKSPQPTHSEVLAGVYKDDLEEQVADAVFTLREKGYNTFESGFHSNITLGLQSIGFTKDQPLPPSVPTSLIDDLKQRGVNISVVEGIDRYSIILQPIERTLDMKTWKEVWDITAEAMPTLSTHMRPENTFTPLAKEFRDGSN
jgi:hypothetical protein